MHELGEREEAKCLTGRGGVEHDPIVVGGLVVEDPREPVEERRLFRPGRYPGHIDLALDLGPQAGWGRVGDPCLHVRDVAVGLSSRVDLHRPQVAFHTLRLRTELTLEDV
jgi:hypothetical protein